MKFAGKKCYTKFGNCYTMLNLHSNNCYAFSDRQIIPCIIYFALVINDVISGPKICNYLCVPLNILFCLPLCRQSGGYIGLLLSTRVTALVRGFPSGFYRACGGHPEHQTLTQCWANVGPVLGNRVLFGATLNVGQFHRRRANINPALVQSSLLVYTMQART